LVSPLVEAAPGATESAALAGRVVVALQPAAAALIAHWAFWGSQRSCGRVLPAEVDKEQASLERSFVPREACDTGNNSFRSCGEVDALVGPAAPSGTRCEPLEQSDSGIAGEGSIERTRLSPGYACLGACRQVFRIFEPAYYTIQFIAFRTCIITDENQESSNLYPTRFH